MIDHDKRNRDIEATKNLLRSMLGMSEEGINNRLMHDAYFRAGFQEILKLVGRFNEND